MRVVFPRLDDGSRAFSIVDRADGVRYRIHEGIAGANIPHDLVHFIVERETGEDGGFWGAVAAGAVFGSMEHVAGQRPPHAQGRSARAIRARGDQLQRAELLAGLVGWVAREQITSTDQVRHAARDALSTLEDPSVDENRVIEAGRILREVAHQWARLVPGQELVLDWPEKPTRRRKRSH